MDYAELGARISFRRKCLKLTQAQLAERAQCFTSFIGNIERGRRKMSLETLCEICAALDCSADELLGLNHTAVQTGRRVLEYALLLAGQEEARLSGQK